MSCFIAQDCVCTASKLLCFKSSALKSRYITLDQDSNSRSITLDQNSNSRSITLDQNSIPRSITLDQDSNSRSITLDQNSIPRSITLDQNSIPRSITLEAVTLNITPQTLIVTYNPRGISKSLKMKRSLYSLFKSIVSCLIS
jgi:hypothetical protein